MSYHDNKFYILGGGRAYTSYKFDQVNNFHKVNPESKYV